MNAGGERVKIGPKTWNLESPERRFALRLLLRNFGLTSSDFDRLEIAGGVRLTDRLRCVLSIAMRTHVAQHRYERSLIAEQRGTQSAASQLRARRLAIDRLTLLRDEIKKIPAIELSVRPPPSGAESLFLLTLETLRWAGGEMSQHANDTRRTLARQDAKAILGDIDGHLNFIAFPNGMMLREWVVERQGWKLRSMQDVVEAALLAAGQYQVRVPKFNLGRGRPRACDADALFVWSATVHSQAGGQVRLSAYATDGSGRIRNGAYMKFLGAVISLLPADARFSVDAVEQRYYKKQMPKPLLDQIGKVLLP